MQEVAEDLEVAEEALHDEEAVAWALRRLARERDEIGRLEHLASLEIERVTAWLDTTAAPLRERAQRLEDSIAAWHTQQLVAHPRRRTLRFPSGTVQARKLPDRFDVDADAFTPWALVHRPALVRTKHEPDKAAIKASVRETGELPPGVQVEPGEVRIYVSVEPVTEGAL